MKTVGQVDTTDMMMIMMMMRVKNMCSPSQMFLFLDLLWKCWIELISFEFLALSLRSQLGHSVEMFQALGLVVLAGFAKDQQLSPYMSKFW